MSSFCCYFTRGWLVTRGSYYLLNLSENIGSFTKENRFRVSEHMVLRRLFRLRKVEEKGVCGKRCTSPSVSEVIKSLRVRWTKHVLLKEEAGNEHKILIVQI